VTHPDEESACLPPAGGREPGVPLSACHNDACARFRYVPENAVHAACLGPRSEPWVPTSYPHLKNQVNPW
jgi:hypothetical protein